MASKKTILITGAGSGFGKGAAIGMAKNGHDIFVDAFVEHVKSLKYGDPNSPDTAIGPIINQRQFDGLLKMIADARADGAIECVGGSPQGLVIPPHVFANVTDQVRLGKSESFGPIAPISRATDEADALRMANDTEFGLSSGVLSGDLARAERFAQQVEAGMTHINDLTAVDLANMPFGGEKNSGLGRFGASGVIEDFTTEHWVSVQKTSRHYPF